MKLLKSEMCGKIRKPLFMPLSCLVESDDAANTWSTSAHSIFKDKEKGVKMIKIMELFIPANT